MFTKENKKEILKKNLIGYYEEINKDKVNIPAFMLAEADIKLIEQKGTLDFWYKKFKHGIRR